MNFSNKAISPVIAIILLLSITVTISVGVYQFLEDYSQNTEESVASNAVIDDLNTRVIDTNKDRSYIQTPYDNLNISRVVLDGNECINNSGVVTSQTLKINLSSCSGSVSSSRPTLTIETEEGVIQLDLSRRDLGIASSVSSSDSSSLSSCFNSSTIGSVGTESPCTEMLIVNRTMLDNALDLSGGVDKYITYDGTNYTFGDSANNIFTGQVTDMSSLFEGESYSNPNNFTADIEYWDTRNVNNMSRMFFYATSFNQSLSNFNTRNVTHMSGMFFSANDFNRPLNSWDISNVEDMDSMFGIAGSFNQPLDSWNTSSVTDMGSMFREASDFNQNISMWCVENIVSKPTNFDFVSGFYTVDSLQPNWGNTC